MRGLHATRISGQGKRTPKGQARSDGANEKEVKVNKAESVEQVTFYTGLTRTKSRETVNAIISVITDSLAAAVSRDSPESPSMDSN